MINFIYTFCFPFSYFCFPFSYFCFLFSSFCFLFLSPSFRFPLFSLFNFLLKSKKKIRRFRIFHQFRYNKNRLSNFIGNKNLTCEGIKNKKKLKCHDEEPKFICIRRKLFCATFSIEIRSFKIGPILARWRLMTPPVCSIFSPKNRKKNYRNKI